MKFSIRTTQTADKSCWTVAITCPNEKFTFDPRELKRSGNLNEGFPVPAVVLDSWKGKIHEPLCTAGNDPSEIKKLADNIIIGDLDPNSNEVEKFGRYLAAVLLGDHWPRILKAADKEEIELELYFDSTDSELNRLPWEMMYGDERPFAGYLGRDVAITRIVPRVEEAKAAALSLPLKVLFVIGRQLDDKLRPGAEYLGMLRRMKIPFIGTPEPRSIDLNTRLLMEATREDLKAAINEFQPHVVHFICHGVVDKDGGRILLTKPSDTQSGGNGQLEADECNAEQLLEDMSDGKAPNNLPPIVVLNACHTADTGNSAERDAASDIKGAYLSLAAEFVAGGVSVTIGMAGEIADAACRIFTRNFYQALIKKEPIALATARGRRAAMYHYENFYTGSVEWVRPTLFAADGVLESLILSEATEEEMLNVAEIPSKYLGDRNLLCDHFSCLEAYQHFRMRIATSSEQKMLAFRVSEAEVGKLRFGKTRLLEEIAAQSVLDDFIPCLIRNGGTIEPPTNFLSLAILLANAMDVTRERFSIKKRIKSFALTEAFELFDLHPVMTSDLIAFRKAVATVKDRLKNLGKPGKPRDLDVEVIKGVILEDFRLLYNDLNGIPDPPEAGGEVPVASPEKAEAPTKPKRKLLLLLDDLHLYEGVAPLLLSEAMTGPYGLGDDTLPIPVIFTYSGTLSVTTNALEEIEKVVRRGKYVVKEDLQRIDDESEARLAYSQYLLSRESPLSFNWLDSKRADVEIVLRTLHKKISGVPSLLYEQNVEGLLDLAYAQDTLLDADDEKIMQSLKQQDEKVLRD